MGNEDDKVDVGGLSDLGLLRAYADVLEELRERDIVRSNNNPVADVAERLFCSMYGWEQMPRSNRGFDAQDADGTRYEVKARRITTHNASRQLGALRGLDERPFDYLAGVIFNRNFRVVCAALVPIEYVMANSAYVGRTNSWKFILRDEVYDGEGVRRADRMLTHPDWK